MNSNLDTTDQIFSTLVVQDRYREHDIIMTVEEVVKCHDGSCVVQGHRLDIPEYKYIAYMSVPPENLELGLYVI